MRVLNLYKKFLIHQKTKKVIKLDESIKKTEYDDILDSNNHTIEKKKNFFFLNSGIVSKFNLFYLFLSSVILWEIIISYAKKKSKSKPVLIYKNKDKDESTLLSINFVLNKLNGPYLIFIKTQKNDIVGVFIDCDLRENGANFFGNSHCFLFRFHPIFRCFTTCNNKEKNYVIYNLTDDSIPKCLAFGGELDLFRFYISQDFKKCYSTSFCNTYSYGKILKSIKDTGSKTVLDNTVLFGTKKKKQSRKHETKLIVQKNDENDDDDDFKRGKLYNYDDMIFRINNLIHLNNPGLHESKKYVIKPPQVSRVGLRRVAWTNFVELCKIMNRSSDHVCHFVLSELGTEGSVVNDGQLILKGRFTLKHIETLLRKYIKEYVTCHMCRGASTKLEKDLRTRLYTIQCGSCGAQKSVSTIKSGYHAVSRGDRRKSKATF